MSTMIRALIFLCCYGFVLSANNANLVRSYRRPEARMQMQDLLGALGARPTCMHEGRWYYERSVIPTIDSCINCRCENGMVRCNMTLCPMYPNVQEGCQLIHQEGSCCPQLVCNENATKKLSNVPEIHDATLLGCTYNDYEFGLGDFIPTSDPCQACYCIHNKTQCVHQNCALPESSREGCRPVYHHGICCPTRYDCSEAMAVPPTHRPFSNTDGCVVDSKFYDEGEAIPSGKPCQHCYCMKGEMICAQQKCDTPMAGCLPVIRDGQCCPERYECPNETTTTMSLLDASNSLNFFNNSQNSLQLHILLDNKQPVDKLTSTTRALEEENELDGFFHTTSASVFPAAQDQKSTSANRDIPTVTPSKAKFAFQSSNGGTLPYAEMKLRLNGTSTDLEAGSNNTPVTASELLNSALPLGSRPTLENSSGSSSSGSFNGIRWNRPFASGSTFTNGQSSSFSSFVNGKGNDRLITHVQAGSQASNQNDNANSIRVNQSINVSAATPPLPSMLIRINGSNVSITSGSSSAIGAAAMSSQGRKALRPVDPSQFDAFEGLTGQAQTQSNNNNKGQMNTYISGMPIDPSSLNEIEGAASVSNPSSAEKLIVQVPYAHLTEYGLAADPTAADAYDGQLPTKPQTAQLTSQQEPRVPVDPTAADAYAGHFSTKPEAAQQTTQPETRVPVDPTQPAEVEGSIRTRPATHPVTFQLTNDTAITVNIRGSPTNQKSPVDPTLPTDVEGGLSKHQGPTVTATISGIPMDPDVTSKVEGVFAPTAPGATASSPAGDDAIPLDPTQAAEIEGALSTLNEVRPAVGLKPTDPSSAESAEIEGTLSTLKEVRPTIGLKPTDPTSADAAKIEGALTTLKEVRPTTGVNPTDPSDAAEIEGALSTLNEVRPAFGLKPTDPSSAEQIEGLVQLAANGQNEIRPSNGTPFNRAAVSGQSIRRAGVMGAPVDPTLATSDLIEGILPPSELPPLNQNLPYLRPSDPTKSDNLEGVSKLRPALSSIFLPVEPTSADRFEGVASASTNKSGNDAVEPFPADSVEGVWQWSQSMADSLNAVPGAVQIFAIRQHANGTDIVSNTGAGPLVAPVRNTTLNVSSSNSNSSMFPASASMLAVQLNGSLPANMIVSVNSNKGSRPLQLSKPTSGSALTEDDNTTDSTVIQIAVEPNAGDEYEGQLHQVNIKVDNQGIEPNPTDEYEGMQRLGDLNQIKLDQSQTSTVRSTTIPTPPSRWAIQTNTAQKKVNSTAELPGSRNQWGVPIQIIRYNAGDILTKATTNTTTVSSTQATTSTKSSTRTSTKSLPRSSTKSSTTTTGSSSKAPTRSSTTTSPTTRITTSRATSTSRNPITSSTKSSPVSLADDSHDEVKSIIQPNNIDQISSMRVNENRRTSTRKRIIASTDVALTGLGQTSSFGAGLNGSGIPVIPGFEPGAPLTGIYENGCFFDGVYYRNYQSIPTTDIQVGTLYDPCLVRLCKEGVVLGPSEQRCPPPIDGCFSTSIPGVCCPVYLCPNYLERNETSYTLRAASGDTLNTEKTKMALAKFCRVGPRFLALNERVVHVMGIQCQTCTCKPKGIVCEPGCAQNLLIATEAPEVMAPRIFPTLSPTTTQPTTTLPTTLPPVTEPPGARSCVIQKKRFRNGEEVSFDDPCHMCSCMDGLIICKVNRRGCRSSRILNALDSFPFS